jgi:NAD(P)-dependent dehydrogenase (short-subunit alcohol dehydrogenase family)
MRPDGCIFVASVVPALYRITFRAGLLGGRSYGYMAAAFLCATKAGIVGLTKSPAIEADRFGITVNAVCPGFIATEAVKLHDPSMLKRVKKGLPSDKWENLKKWRKLWPSWLRTVLLI